MKQFALAGLGCGGEGSRGLVTVTDMVGSGEGEGGARRGGQRPRPLNLSLPPPPQDRIEASNLSRQFLFRGSDVDKFKSERVCAAATAANPTLHARAYEAAVGPDTELAPFDDGFWRDQVRAPPPPPPAPGHGHPPPHTTRAGRHRDRAG